MKRNVFTLFLSLFLLALSLQGAGLEKLHRLYQQKKYKEACQYGLRVFNRYKKEPKFLMLYGLACLNADYIDRLAVPMTGLRKSKAERVNATYFATIILQKKLLYHALLDGVDISELKLPTTDYILSKVFDRYVQGAYRREKGKYLFDCPLPDGRHKTCILYIDKKRSPPQMVIEERIDGRSIQIHRYW